MFRFWHKLIKSHEIFLSNLMHSYPNSASLPFDPQLPVGTFFSSFTWHRSKGLLIWEACSVCNIKWLTFPVQKAVEFNLDGNFLWENIRSEASELIWSLYKKTSSSRTLHLYAFSAWGTPCSISLPALTTVQALQCLQYGEDFKPQCCCWHFEGCTEEAR